MRGAPTGRGTACQELMVRVDGEDGRCLELRIVGYQFPDTRRTLGPFDHDADWLIVAGRGQRWPA